MPYVTEINQSRASFCLRNSQLGVTCQSNENPTQYGLYTILWSSCTAYEVNVALSNFYDDTNRTMEFDILTMRFT